jgi:hypothetical protein
MRTALFIVMMLCLTTHLLAQNGGGVSADGLAGTTWYINWPLGADTGATSYILRTFNKGTLSYGFFVSFHENGTSYESRYRAPCGMDCFTIVNGQFEARAHNLLRISVHQVRQQGLECYKPVNEQRPPNSTLFQMTFFQSDTLLLTKVD